MKIKRQLFILFFLSAFSCYSQDENKSHFIQRMGLGVSFNAVADEVVLGVSVYAEKDLWEWKNGRLYTGLSSFYGSYPNTNSQINQFTKGKTSLFQPLQLLIGHQFIVLNRRLLLRTALGLGPSIFKQKIKFDDARYDLHETYKYSSILFTAQSKIGLGIRIGKTSNLELYTNLPVVNPKVAPMGLGLGFSIDF